MKFWKKKEFDDINILKSIYSKDRLVRYAQFLVGLLCAAVAYNVFILPSNIVFGLGGIGVILNYQFGADPALVILIGSLILLIFSYFLLGKEKTWKSVLGSLLYPLFVKLTVNLTQFVDLGSTEPVVIALFGAVIMGFGFGLIFKAGYTSGGTDILKQIISKYFKMSIGKSMVIVDGIIITSSIFFFGFQKFMYSVISLYIISMMTDKVILGISQSKAFYIITEKEDQVKRFILNHLSHGVTVFDVRGGYTGDRGKMIMCIIPTKEYFLAKEGILKIDPDAFFLVTDSYEVSGGA